MPDIQTLSQRIQDKPARCLDFATLIKTSLLRKVSVYVVAWLSGRDYQASKPALRHPRVAPYLLCWLLTLSKKLVLAFVQSTVGMVSHPSGEFLATTVLIITSTPYVG